MTLNLLMFGIGLTGLYFGAEWLVGASARIATALGVSTFVVGLTLVSMGTSAPELIVSGLASYRQSGGLAVGNVLGSNIANIALILGISAIILPIGVKHAQVARDAWVMIGAAALVPIMGWSGSVSRPEGFVLLILFTLYMTHLALTARRESASTLALLEEKGIGEPSRDHIRRDAGIALVGLVVLAVGAHLLVTGATSIATMLGVPEVVIGLTLVAFGTSLPELAASVSAARRGEGQILIGNIIGSNIFNITLILGAAAVIRPLPVESSIVHIDALIVLGLSLALIPVIRSGHRIDRWEGGMLCATYVAFILWTFLSGGG